MTRMPVSGVLSNSALPRSGLMPLPPTGPLHALRLLATLPWVGRTGQAGHPLARVVA